MTTEGVLRDMRIHKAGKVGPGRERPFILSTGARGSEGRRSKSWVGLPEKQTLDRVPCPWFIWEAMGTPSGGREAG